MLNLLRALLLLCCISAIPSPALACGDNEYEQCALFACACLPKIDGTFRQAGEATKKAVNDLA